MPAQTDSLTVVITGANGRVAGLLRRVWSDRPPRGLSVLWSARCPGHGLHWDLFSATAPALPRGSVILHLAGVVRGSGMAANPRMIPALMCVAHASGAAAVVLASTVAVYAPGSLPAAEDQTPAPVSAYGLSKLEAEEAAFAASGGLPVTALRIGNVLGADALFGQGGTAPLRLDPVPGQADGPLRSWIGPQTLALCLPTLLRLAAAGQLPPLLNLAQHPPLPMAALLRASGRVWDWGAPNPAAVAVHTLNTERLARWVRLPPATPAGLLAELSGQEVAA